MVRAEDDPRDLTQPRGKQDWHERPHAIWYERTTGIWQPVWLEPVPATHLESLRWTPDLDRGVLRVRVRAAGPSRGGLRLSVRLTLRGSCSRTTSIRRPPPSCSATSPWTAPGSTTSDGPTCGRPTTPTSSTRRSRSLLDGEVVDEVRSYCGLRTVGARGRHFVLNGRGYPLRMVLAQNYWPSSHLAAPDGAAIRREVELVKELGFNAVRIHQKVEDPRFLGWCDRLGVLAWGEMPSALEFGPRTIRRITSEWLEVLDRDASSPALVAWVPFNESWGVPNLENDPAQRHAVQALYHLTKAIDSSRPVVGNDGWENLVSDMIGVHDYSPSGQVLAERYGSHEAFQRTMEQVRPFYRRITLPGLAGGGQPLIVSEFGGHDVRPGREDFWNGYGAVGSAEELLERYRELVRRCCRAPSSPASATPSSPTPGRSATACSRRTACRRPTRPRSRRSTGCPRPPCPGRRWRRSRSCTRRGEGSSDLSLPGRPRLLRRPATSCGRGSGAAAAPIRHGLHGRALGLCRGGARRGRRVGGGGGGTGGARGARRPDRAAGPGAAVRDAPDARQREADRRAGRLLLHVHPLRGLPRRLERHKSADLRWFDLAALPAPVVPHERRVLDLLLTGQVPPILIEGFG